MAFVGDSINCQIVENKSMFGNLSRNNEPQLSQFNLKKSFSELQFSHDTLFFIIIPDRKLIVWI